MTIPPMNGPPATVPATIQFRVSADHSILLDPEALEENCAAAALAMGRDAATIIRVVLEEDERFRSEIARLESGAPDADRRWSLADLTPELERLAAEITYLEKGIRFLFSPDLLPLLGFPERLGTGQLAAALQAFVRYEWERTPKHRNPTLQLDLYSNERPRLSARVRLDRDDTVAFLKRQGLPPDFMLGRLRSLNLGFRDLGPGLALKRALPALLSNLAYHAISLERRGSTFAASDIPPVDGWSMGLA